MIQLAKVLDLKGWQKWTLPLQTKSLLDVALNMKKGLISQEGEEFQSSENYFS